VQRVGQEYRHIPVMVREVLDLLVTQRDGTYLDCTVGLAGHAEALLEKLSRLGRLVGIDADKASLEAAAKRLSRFEDRVQLFHANYADLEEVLEEAGIEAVDGALFDLGLSSAQLEDRSRGLAHALDGPLDMRFDTSHGPTAAELLNSLPRKRLTEIFRDWGELRRPGAVSGAIERARAAGRLETTGQLVSALKGVLMAGPRRERQLGQVFQAIRIAVNGELESLDRGLAAAGRCIKPGGVLTVISYHSLEDRKVKHFFREHKAGWNVLTKKPLRASRNEVSANPRSRSAKLRAAARSSAAGARRRVPAGEEDVR
jgi:16S rRNA (cytosine1402-N4)-methyltransferase